jgi:hypothetical protein
MTESRSLTIMNRSMPSGLHICAFSSWPAGRDDVVMPFLADGIRAGDACRRSGTWQQAAAAAQGTKGSGVLRATGDMPSVLNHPDGRTEFFRYEAMLGDVVPSLPAGPAASITCSASARRS